MIDEATWKYYRICKLLHNADEHARWYSDLDERYKKANPHKPYLQKGSEEREYLEKRLEELLKEIDDF